MRSPPIVLRFLLALFAVLGAAQSRLASAQVIADWGTVSTPIASDVTFSFAQYDVTQNFTHQYLFSLEGAAGATYSVTFNFNACSRGCGNPSLSYGIYDLTGGLIEPTTSGTYVLTAGAFSFQVKGDGFGAGNSVDYWGAVTISPTAGEIVAPVPEAGTWLLLAPGLLAVVWFARRRRALIVATALALQACGGPAPPDPGQVVARVNGAEISIHQVEHAARVERATFAGEPDRGALLEKLIDRELAVQKALAQKLDRRMEVLQRLEETRRDVLAAAYAESLAASLAKPSRADIERFYAGHPELFARRKVYRLREIALPAGIPAVAEVKQLLAAKASVDEIAGSLARRGLRVIRQDVLRAAEQLPMQALERLQGAAEGQVVAFESPRVLYVYGVLGFQVAPLDLAAATPLIAEHLERRAGQEAMAAELRGLRAAAVIERVDDRAASADGRALARN